MKRFNFKICMILSLQHNLPTSWMKKILTYQLVWNYLNKQNALLLVLSAITTPIFLWFISELQCKILVFVIYMKHFHCYGYYSRKIYIFIGTGGYKLSTIVIITLVFIICSLYVTHYYITHSTEPSIYRFSGIPERKGNKKVFR